MPIIDEADPSSSRTTIRVGQDAGGHWLVQESHGLVEGRFVSREAAMMFARGERSAYMDAVVELSSEPLVPVIPFRPVQPWEMATRRAA